MHIIIYSVKVPNTTHNKSDVPRAFSVCCAGNTDNVIRIKDRFIKR